LDATDFIDTAAAAVGDTTKMLSLTLRLLLTSLDVSFDGKNKFCDMVHVVTGSN